MKRVNNYGVELQNNFITKAKIQDDIDNNNFDGTWRYEKNIETVEDACGWLLETYDYEALDVLNEEWIKESNKVWGLNIYTLKEELEKCFE